MVHYRREGLKSVGLIWSGSRQEGGRGLEDTRRTKKEDREARSGRGGEERRERERRTRYDVHEADLWPAHVDNVLLSVRECALLEPEKLVDAVVLPDHSIHTIRNVSWGDLQGEPATRQSSA